MAKLSLLETAVGSKCNGLALRIFGPFHTSGEGTNFEKPCDLEDVTSLCYLGYQESLGTTNSVSALGSASSISDRQGCGEFTFLVPATY